MRLVIWLGVPAVAAAVLLAALAVYRNHRIQRNRSSVRTHVVLIGASIGHSWRLADWPARVHTTAFTAESVAAWQFDKSPAVDEVLMRPAPKFHLTRSFLKSLLDPPKEPSIVILKECSAYFPGDLPVYRESLRTWVHRLRERGLPVVLATVVPVTRERAARDSGKQQQLLEFNVWLRQYAAEHAIPLLDIESVLREPGAGSYLRQEFAAADGSHLNAAAYALLDQALLTFVSKALPAPAGALQRHP